MKITAMLAVTALAAFLAGVAANHLMPTGAVVYAAADRVFEIRTYVAPPGKLEALKSRFRDHTIRIFKKHGMTSIGYWTPLDAPASENTLTYVLAFPSREAATKAWADFGADPEWVKVKADSEKDGRLTIQGGVTSVFVSPADFSPIK
jgi:NIPSNAP